MKLLIANGRSKAKSAIEKKSKGIFIDEDRDETGNNFYVCDVFDQKCNFFRLKRKLPIALVLAIFIFSLIAHETVEAQNTIDYMGYRISVSIPKSANNSVVTIKKRGKTLATHADGISKEYGSTIELISLLGTNKKQLVISQYTGGYHCCSLYWIYELDPKFRLIFQSKNFETLGYSDTNKLFQNIDNDNHLEIVDFTPAFHYFNDLAFVSSPAPKLIFDYNLKIGKFELANRRFSSYLLKDKEAEIAETNKLKVTDRSQYSVNTFGIFLDYLYAGKEQTAWQYYQNERKSSLGRINFHDDAEIKKTLDSDPAYRTIYNK